MTPMPKYDDVVRTLVIGDVHGCLRELDDLLARSGWTPEARLVFVGDLVAKGPDSAGVIARARELGGSAVRGNHDHRCLSWRDAVKAGREPPPLGPSHRAVCEALTEDAWTWLEAQPHHLRLDDVNAIVVHAGLVPGRPLEAQRPEDMMNMRSIRPDGTVSRRVDEGVPWGSLWPGPLEVVYGHDALRGLQRHAHATGLDTGCVYGGRLTGYWLPDRELVSVPAQRSWFPVAEGAE
jgi:hypothetical protein